MKLASAINARWTESFQKLQNRVSGLETQSRLRRKKMLQLAASAVVEGLEQRRLLSYGGTPYLGSPAAIPGTVQAENFDSGGEGIAYHNPGDQNQGGAYRPSEGVGIESTSDSGGGYDVGWATAGEWLNYTVNVQSTGMYGLSFRVASGGAGGTFHLADQNGTPLTPELTAPNTGGWQNFTTVTAPAVALTAGSNVLKLLLDTNGGTGAVSNFNYFTATYNGPVGSSTLLYWDPSLAATANGGAGTWDTSTADWRSGSATGPLVVWNNSGDANGPYEAIFPSTGGAITLGTSVTAVSLSFAANGYSVNGGSSGYIVNMSGGEGQIDVVSGATAIITAGFSTTPGLTKTNSGTLDLNGAISSSASANLNVQQGSLIASTSQSWQFVEVASPGTLTLQGTNTGLIASGAITVDGLLNHNAGAIQAATLNVDSTGTFRDAGGSLSGSTGGITISNSGLFDSVISTSLAGTTGSFSNTGTYEVDNGGGSGTTTLGVAFTNSWGTINVSAGTLSIPNSISVPNGTGLTLTGSGTFTVPNLEVDQAAITQLSGKFSIPGTFEIGYNFLSGGSYDLAGGTLSAGALYVGTYSTASLIQTGGTLIAGHTEVGSYGTGIITQSGGISTFYDMYFGIYGNGTWNLSGGSSNAYTISDGRLGYGTINLSGSATLNASAWETIGDYGGNGSFTQTGTSVNNSGVFNLGAGGVGFYNLSGGGFTTQWEGIGATSGSSGTFIQGSGTTAYVSYAITIGSGTSCSGLYLMRGGQLSNGYTFNIGTSGGSGTFNESGGIVNIPNGSLIVGNQAGSSAVILSGGSLSVSSNTYIGFSTPATMIQSGGTFSTSGDLVVSGDTWDPAPNGIGTYNLSAGQVTSNYTVLGYTANGTFTQTGGTHTTNLLVLNGLAGSIGTYNQSAGTLNAGFVYNVQKPSAAGSSFVNEGAAYTLNLSAQVPFWSGQSPSSWSVDWGDTSANQYGAYPGSVQHIYYNGGNSYTIHSTVNTNSGTVAANPLQVMVNDVPATLAPIPAQSVNTGSVLSISTTFADPGIHETHTGVINWGDGSSSLATISESNGSGTLTASHTYLVHGNYTADLQVTDSGGAVAALPFAVTSNYVAPSLSIGSPTQSALTNTPVIVPFDDHGPETTGVTSWQINWGDGSSLQTVTNQPDTINTTLAEWDISHAYSTPGTYTIHAVATDSSGPLPAITRSISVTAPPGLMIDIRSATGSKSAVATSIGQVIPLQVWAVVAGNNANGAYDTIDSVSGSFFSSMISSGSVHGNLSNQLTFEFDASGSQNGTQQDLNGDGNLDVGSINDGSIAGFMDARVGGASDSGTVIGNSYQVQIGTLYYTVTSLPNGSETDINFSPRVVSGPGYAAVWWEDNQPENETTASFSAGSPLRINAATGTAPNAQLSSGSSGSSGISPDTNAPASTPQTITESGDSGQTIVSLAGSGNFTVSYNAGAQQYTFAGTGTSATVQVSSSGLLGFTLVGDGESDALTVLSGDPTLLNDAGADGTQVSVIVNPNAAIGFDSTEHLLSLSIGAAAIAQMLNNGQDVLVTNTLSIAGSANAWTGKLDIGNNDTIVHDGTLSTINNQLKTGYNNGYWNGPGIDSSAAATDSTHLTAVGSLLNQKTSSEAYYSAFAGQSVIANDMLIKYTYYGDADLSGSIDGNDYSLTDAGYISRTTGWVNGDFNYDGSVDGSDYTLIDNDFNTQGPPIVDRGDGLPSITLAANQDFPTGILPTLTPAGAAISSWQVNWGNGHTQTFSPSDEVSNPYSDTNAEYQASFVALNANGNPIYSYPHTNISVTYVAPLPAAWSQSDMDLTQSGAPSISAGTAQYIPGTGTFHLNTPVSSDVVSTFAGQNFAGDGYISAEVNSAQANDTSGTGGAGVTMLDPVDQSFASVMVTPTGSVQLAVGGTGSWSSNIVSSLSVNNGGSPIWVELQRSGLSFTGYYSTDGISWSAFAQKSMPINIGMSVNAEGGVAVTNEISGTSTFSGLGAASGSFTNVSMLGMAAGSSHEADLSFYNSGTGTGATRIFRANPNNTQTLVGIVPEGATSYKDFTVTPGNQYRFSIGGPAASAGAAPPAGNPTLLSTAVAQYQISIDASELDKWVCTCNPNTTYATGVRLNHAVVWADNEYDALIDAGVQMSFSTTGSDASSDAEIAGDATPADQTFQELYPYLYPPNIETGISSAGTIFPHEQDFSNPDGNITTESLAEEEGISPNTPVLWWNGICLNASNFGYVPLDVSNGNNQNPTTNDCGCSTKAPNTPSPPPTTTSKPVYYSDGVVGENVTDLQSSGYGIDWGVTRNWTNQPMSTVTSNVFGNNEDEEQLSRLVFEGSSVGVATDGANIYWFDPGPNNTFIERFGYNQTLSLVTVNGAPEYDWVDENGNLTRFYGSENSNTYGDFESYTDAGGDQALANYNNGGLASITITSPNQPGSDVYAYSYSGSHVSQIELEQLSASNAVTPVQTVKYTYYGANDPNNNGNAGDLEFAQVYDGNGSVSSQLVNTDYYRYYTPEPVLSGTVRELAYYDNGQPIYPPYDCGVVHEYEVTLTFSTAGLVISNLDQNSITVDGGNYGGNVGPETITYGSNGIGTITYNYYALSTSQVAADPSGPINVTGMTFTINGLQDGLKYVVEGQDYARLQAAVGDPTTASAAAIAPYATNFFEYDSSGRIALEEPLGSGLSTGSSSGKEIITYSYLSNPDQMEDNGTSIDTNVWTMQTTVNVLNPGNSSIVTQDVVYTSAYGEVLLDDSVGPATGISQQTGYEYDEMGRLTAVVSQSAMGNSDRSSDTDPPDQVVIGSLSGGGLIRTLQYYTSTTATPGSSGGVAGYVEEVGVQNGPGSPIIPQQSYTYTAHFDSLGNEIFPEAGSTLYTGNPANGNGSGEETTTFSHTFYPGTNAIEEEDETMPSISSSENGPGTPDTQATVLNLQGWVVWSRDGDGSIDYTAYNYATGAVTAQIQDVQLANTSDYSPAYLPGTWTTVAGGGLNLLTQQVVDVQGRPIEQISPNGNITYLVYNDPAHEVIAYPGWNASTGMPTGPTEVYDDNWSLGYDESLTSDAVPHLTNGVPDGTESINSGNIQSLTRDVLDVGGQVVQQDAYFNLSGATYSTGSVSFGTSGTNFYTTQYQYDAAGRLVETTDPNGTITETVYNALSEPIHTLVGTSDGTGSTPSNLVDVEDDYYDGNNSLSTSFSPGDGDLTETVENPGAGEPARITDYFYDWRDREVGELDGALPDGEDVNDSPTGGPGAVLHVSQYDDQDELVVSTQFAAGGLPFTDGSFTGAYAAPAAGQGGQGGQAGQGGQSQPNGLIWYGYDGDLRGETEYQYDDQGRVYQTNVFSVEPVSSVSPAYAGEVGSAVTTNTFYDRDGNVIATESPAGGATGGAGLWTKDVYDGANRLIEQDQTNGAGGSSWSNAGSIANDVVFSQQLYQYDGDDNVIETVEKDRLDSDSSTATGALAASGSTAARISYSGSYYDAADRDIEDVDAGTNGGSAWTRPASVPARSSTTLVTSYTYDPAGNVSFVTDPKGIITAYGYDLLGRTTVTVADWTASTFVGPVSTSTLPSPTDSTNQTTTYQYDGDNNVISLTAVMPSGETSQTTDYIYGVSGGAISDNDLLSKIEYPDPTTGNAGASSSDTETYTYDALGDPVTDTDRNGTMHQYGYDTQGRLISDTITHWGNSSIDQTVSQLAYTYDDEGNLSTATSYNAGGGVVNQVSETYDPFSQLASDAQSHHGAVTGTTPTVKYTYAPTNGDRLTGMTYPNGRTINYNYNGSSGLDSAAGRISSITDSNGSLIQGYQYQGTDTPMVTTSGNGVVGTTTFDSLGRISSLTYTNSSGGVIDGYSYTYDNDGNVLSKTNLVLSQDSETYGYDNLNRLTSFSRGTISGGTISSPTTSESWNYDALGNWKSNSITVGATTTTTSRTNNAQNQIASVSSQTASPVYDADGNTLKDPSGQQYMYDAWNRLVAVKNSSGGTIASYSYDALGRQIQITENNVTTDLYYSDRDQVIEERVNGGVTAQYVWSPFYVDQMVERDDMPVTTGAATTLTRRLYVEQDADYNVMSLTDVNGNVVERYRYDPYGNVTVLSPDGTIRGDGTAASSLYGWVYLYQGLRLGPGTGLYYSRLRQTLDPTLGRFDQEDPDGDINGPNFYQSRLSNPVAYDDPSGTQSWYQGWGSAVWVLVGGYGGNSAGNAWSYGLQRSNQTADQAMQLVPDALSTAAAADAALASGGNDDEEFFNELDKDLEDLENVGSQPQGTNKPQDDTAEQPAAERESCPNDADDTPRQPGGDEESQPQANQGNDGKKTGPNQMQKQVDRGQAPGSVDRVDKANPQLGEKLPHVHFNDGPSLYNDGTWHGAGGERPLTNAEQQWLLDNGWDLPG